MTVLVALIVRLLLDSCNYWMLVTMQITVAIEETNVKVSFQISKNSLVSELTFHFFTGVYFVSCTYRKKYVMKALCDILKNTQNSM